MGDWRKAIVALGAAAVMAGASGTYAEEPRPSLGSAEDNVAYALSSICAPFVLDGADVAALPLRRNLVANDGWKDPTFRTPDVKTVRVGFAGFVHVSVAAEGAVRRCEIVAAKGGPQSLRAAAMAVIAARAERFAPTKSRYLPGRFATEDMLCAAPDSSRPRAFVLMSAAPEKESGGVALLVSVMEAPTRGKSCDHAGVKMNFRQLAPDDPSILQGDGR